MLMLMRMGHVSQVSRTGQMSMEVVLRNAIESIEPGCEGGR
jgi:hypothetical protein